MACVTLRHLVKSFILRRVPPRVAPKVLRGSVGVLSVAFLLNVLDAPSEVVVLPLLGGCVEKDVGLGSVANTSALGVLAGGFDGVYDGVGEDGVASDGLVVHQPYVHDAAAWVDGVEGVLGI